MTLWMACPVKLPRAIQRRAKNGRWTGRPPKVVPLRLHEELTRRRLSEAYDLLREDLVAAVQVLGQVVRDEAAPPKDRIKAAELIMDRVMGKAPIKVDVQPVTRFEEFGEAVVVWQDDVIEAFTVDELRFDSNASN